MDIMPIYTLQYVSRNVVEITGVENVRLSQDDVNKWNRAHRGSTSNWFCIGIIYENGSIIIDDDLSIFKNYPFLPDELDNNNHVVMKQKAPVSFEETAIIKGDHHVFYILASL